MLKQKKRKQQKILAKNQGLYNSFLAAGLIWAILDKNNFEQIALFFLSCVTITGIYGAYTTQKIKLFFVQSAPACIGIIAILLTK